MIQIEMMLHDAAELRELQPALDAIYARRKNYRGVADGPPFLASLAAAQPGEFVPLNGVEQGELLRVLAGSAPTTVALQAATVRADERFGEYAKAAADSAFVAEQVQVADPVAAPDPAESDVVDAVKSLAERAGVPAAAALLAEYGAKRVGDVPADRRREFIGRTQEIK